MALDLTTLAPGTLVATKDGRVLEVVSVVDTSGARGGLVDCKRPGGVRSRTAGYELGDQLTHVVAGPLRHKAGLVTLG